MNEKMTFGEFLTEKRKSRGVLMKDLADELGVSKVYLCDVEKGRKAAPKAEHLQIIAEQLNLSEEERNIMYDLAATAHAYPKGISPDLLNIIRESGFNAINLDEAERKTIDEIYKFIRENSLILAASVLMVVFSMISISVLQGSQVRREYGVYRLCGGICVKSRLFLPSSGR